MHPYAGQDSTTQGDPQAAMTQNGGRVVSKVGGNGLEPEFEIEGAILWDRILRVGGAIRAAWRRRPRLPAEGLFPYELSIGLVLLGASLWLHAARFAVVHNWYARGSLDENSIDATARLLGNLADAGFLLGCLALWRL